MNFFVKRFWMGCQKPSAAINSGMVDYVMPDPTGLIRVVAKPVSLSDRDPLSQELTESGFCWYGYWHNESWHWEWDRNPWASHTHFLPAGVEVLPATCFNPLEDS